MKIGSISIEEHAYKNKIKIQRHLTVRKNMIKI